MYELDNILRQEYLDMHLPYRINSMLSPDLITHRRSTRISSDMIESCYKDSLILEPSFEVSILFGRALLQFLGIGLDPRSGDLASHSPRPTDLTVKSIYPDRDFVQLDDELVVPNRTNFCTIIKIANKSVAHMTSTLSNADEHGQLEKARLTICQLMLKHVPDINKKNIWWYDQVERFR
jgi:hypothetical protein